MDHTPVIVAARRTPFGKRGGALSTVHPADLLAGVQNAALAELGLDPGHVELVLTGTVTKVGEQAYNIGRVGTLTGGWPVEVPAVTFDAQCGSSQQAVNMAAATIAAGNADVVIASGIESMSRVPLGSDRELGEGDPFSDSYRRRFELTTAGESAERIAEKWNITRVQCDEFACRSHELAGAARDRVASELAPVLTPQGDRADRDECIRGTSMDDLAGLKTVFRPAGYHTAGSSSPITDGASAVVVMSMSAATKHGLRPLARVVAQTIVGVDPTLRLTGPIPATRRLLQLSGLSLDDIDLFEINEAFSSVVLAWRREFDVDWDKVNPNGGAIAIGHPVGATGARLVGSATHELHRRGSRYALIAMCCGGGLGTGTILERIES